MPRWMRRLRNKPAIPGDSPERVHEKRNPEASVDTPIMAIDRAIFGGFSDAPTPRKGIYRY